MAGELGNAEKVVVVGAVLGGLYLLYQAIQGAKAVGGAVGSAVSAGAQAVASAAKPLATVVAAPAVYSALALYNLWSWASGPTVVDSGNVILPDGTKLPMSQLKIAFSDQYNVATFPYGSSSYVIVPNPDPNGVSYDTNGDYHAINWNDFAATLGS